MIEAEKGARAPLEPRLQAHLGRQLRRLFNVTAAEPIPDRFADLLDQLDRSPPPPQPAASRARPQEAI